MNLDSVINRKLQSLGRDFDKSKELQTIIHPDIRVKRNSVNVLIGRTGSGKTYNIFREIAKICELHNPEFHLFIYITDKDYDPTFEKTKALLKLPTIFCKYDDAYELLTTIKECKGAYDEVVQNQLEDKLTEESRIEILKPLHVNDFSTKSLQTIVLLDDCLRIFQKKNNKIVPLLYENRQPKNIYFLTLHDIFALPPSLKTNIHTIWIFGRYNEQKIKTAYHQLNLPISKDEFWNEYKTLGNQQAIIIYYDNDRTQLEKLLM
jgi:hypothetical protein